MGKVESGVFPVHVNDFEVNVGTDVENWVTVAELEECNLAIDNTTEEWNSFENEGWGSALVTAKKSSIGIKGKRCIGDAGNDYIAEKLMANGQDAYISARITTPAGKIITWAKMACAVTNAGSSGAATNVGGLEATLTGHGKPTVTEAQ